MHVAKRTSNTGGDSIKVDCDQVRLDFDWTPPAENGLARFQSRIERRGRKRAVDFTIDLNRLQRFELERLNTFLVRRSAGLSTQYETVRNLSWLLEISLRQGSSELSRSARQQKVRELLLVSS
jgi:hypothetical protein